MYLNLITLFCIMSQAQQIIVQTKINSSITNVWNAFTQGEHIVEWNFASPEWHCPAAMIDLEVGGSFSYKMAAKDESFQFDFDGTFTQVDVNKQLNYVLSDQRKVEVSFEQKEGYILLTELFEAENENPIELQQNGWQAILDNFKKYTEGL